MQNLLVPMWTSILRRFSSPHLRSTETVEESKSVAKFVGFHVIVAASGMCDAGRIRHHLKRWLWHANATVLFTGFQAQGTLGRFLVDGVKAVRIQGEEIKVAARIRRVDEYSGHADGPELARSGCVAASDSERCLPGARRRIGACRALRANCRTYGADREGLHSDPR